MKSQEKRQQIFEKNRKMTEGNQSTIEQCLAALTQLVVANHQPISWRSKIEKEIRYLPEFRGEAGTLPSFIEAVDRALADFPSSCDDVYKIIFNLKIQGMAKNVLSVSPPATWDECKQRLKKHYRASKNQMEITSIINNLKVRSIKDLDYRITKILEYISELALFEDDSETVTNIFSGMLVQRTKELVSGTLAFAIMKKLKIQEVREIVVSFVGQDEGNLKSSLLLKHTINNTECHSKYYQNQNYYSDRNSRYENEKPKQLQQNISKYDRETRHHTNSSQQHSYNTRSYHNNNYNRNRHDVTNSSNEPLRQDSDSTRRQQYRQSEPMEVDVISQTPFETNTTEDIFFYQLASDRNKILLKLTIENQEYLALLDTGSTVSLLNTNKIGENKYKILTETTTPLNTIEGRVRKFNKTVSTKCPKEFQYPCNSRMKWLAISMDKPYDLLLGMDFVVNNIAKIVLKDQLILLTNGATLYFISKEFEVNVLEECKIQKEQLDDLNKKEKEVIERLLKKYNKLLYKENDILTSTTTITHEINTTTDKPINSKLYRYPPKHEAEVRRQMEEMEAQGIIRKSKSRYSSPIIVVPKKLDSSGVQKYRIVVDYRRLNQVTIDDKYPLPNIDSILDKLGKAQYFTTIDLAKGYHQILLAKKDIEKTAFVTPAGLYEYVRMPFGLKNAPATFQRLMNDILREYINKICVVYLDDILIFSTTLEEHEISLSKIFYKLQQHNLKIQSDKCSFMKKSTSFLGHILTKEGMKPNPEKVRTIQEIPLPKTEKQLRGFLGTTGFYRKFIRNYASVAYPMIKYLQKNNKINSSDPQYITAFEKLKNLITTHPILKYPEFDKQFVVTTDASDYAIGAVLSQQGHPICYVSRTLNKHEKSYSTTDKEFLAIVYSVNYFRPYLHGNKFKIRTDHLPIKYMNDKYKGKEFSQRHQRWLLKLQEYNFEIEYLKGHENKVADYLSRLTNAEKIRKNNETESNMQISSTEEEESRQWIRIKEEIVNKYKLQLILTYNIEKEIQTIHNRKIIEINPLGNEDYIKDLLKCHIKPGIIGIFADVSDRDYHKIQLLLISTFSTSTTKFVKCTLRAKEILNEDDLHKQISLYHTEESLHSGINECYNSLKNKIYFPK